MNRNPLNLSPRCMKCCWIVVEQSMRNALILKAINHDYLNTRLFLSGSLAISILTNSLLNPVFNPTGFFANTF